MILDHRTYTLFPGRLPEFLKLYETEGWAVQTGHLGLPHGWYVSHDIGELNQIVHIWKYADLMDREQRRAKLAADPRWQAYLAKTASMFMRMENKILRGSAFFPVK